MNRRTLAALGLLAGFSASPVLAQSNNPDFKLHNRGSVVINEIYVSSSGVQSWGRDRLGENTLSPGRNTNIVLGVFTGSGDHARLTRQRRMRTDASMTADE